MSKISSARPKRLVKDYIVDGIGDGDGRFGRGIQYAYDESGIITNYSNGPDLPQYNIEIKTLMVESITHVSVVTCNLEKFKQNKGADVLEKLNTWHLYRLSKVDEERVAIHSFEAIDWSNIHDEFKKEFSMLLEDLDNNSKKVDGRIWTLAESNFFVMERTNPDNSINVKLRIKGNKFKQLISMARSSTSFHNMFDEVN